MRGFSEQRRCAQRRPSRKRCLLGKTSCAIWFHHHYPLLVGWRFPPPACTAPPHCLPATTTSLPTTTPLPAAWHNLPATFYIPPHSIHQPGSPPAATCLTTCLHLPPPAPHSHRTCHCAPCLPPLPACCLPAFLPACPYPACPLPVPSATGLGSWTLVGWVLLGHVPWVGLRS